MLKVGRNCTDGTGRILSHLYSEEVKKDIIRGTNKGTKEACPTCLFGRKLEARGLHFHRGILVGLATSWRVSLSLSPADVDRATSYTVRGHRRQGISPNWRHQTFIFPGWADLSMCLRFVIVCILICWTCCECFRFASETWLFGPGLLLLNLCWCRTCH